MSQNESRNPNAPGKFYVPFDEWIYRNIIDLCLDFCYNYQDINTEEDEIAVSRCENIFEMIIDFAQDCDEFPEELQDPPLEEWSEMDGMQDGVIHPRRALYFVMQVMNELKRQQMDKGRDRNFYIEKYGLEEESEATEKSRGTYSSIFQKK